MSKNSRALAVTVRIRGMAPQIYVVSNKTCLQNLLYSLAVRHWHKRHNAPSLPRSKQAVVEQFFGDPCDNVAGWSATTCLILSEETVKQMLAVSKKCIDRWAKEAAGPVG
jgi:hypothetical protein